MAKMAKMNARQSMGLKAKPVTGMATSNTGRSTTQGPKTGPVSSKSQPASRNSVPHGSYKLTKMC